MMKRSKRVKRNADSKKQLLLVISFAVRARMPVQANPATRPEGSPHNYHPDDEVNRSQHIPEVGNLKHDSCLSVSYLSAPTTPRSVI
jgi:hypothetical protein